MSNFFYLFVFFLILNTSNLSANTKLFFFGGYKSCDGGFPPASVKTYQRHILPIVQKNNLEALVVCFKGARKVRYSEQGSGVFHEIKVDKSYEKMRDLFYPESHISRFIVVSFSYGAWLSMKLLESLPHYIDIDLITIDAISRKDCRVHGPWKGCKRFPKDVDQSLIETRNWVNFYQRKDHFLRGSKAFFADYNFEIFDTNHHNISKNIQIIKKLEEFVDLK